MTDLRLFDVADVRPHPCPYPDAVIDLFARLLPRDGLVLDPFAGSGGIHRLATAHRGTVGVELEAEWAGRHPATIIGDATALPFPDDTFDAVATSPAYGNRLADQCVRPDATTISYAHALGRRCTPGSGAALQWGDAYRRLHARAIAEMVRVVRPGGLVLVNMKDHRRAGRRQHVVAWWGEQLTRAGARWLRLVPLHTGGRPDAGPQDVDATEYVLIHQVST
jgi:SAM-dependent methyltransferase